MPRFTLLYLILALFAGVANLSADSGTNKQVLVLNDLTELSWNPDDFLVGTIDKNVIAISKITGAISKTTLSDIASLQSTSQEIQVPSEDAILVPGGSALYLVDLAPNKDSTRVQGLTITSDGVPKVSRLTDLPAPLSSLSSLVTGNKLYLAGEARNNESLFRSLELSDVNNNWQSLPSLPVPAREGAKLVKAIESIYYIGGISESGTPDNTLYYHPLYGWRSKEAPPLWNESVSHAKVGDSHTLFLIGESSNRYSAYLYHAIGDTWINAASIPVEPSAIPSLIGSGNEIFLLSDSGAQQLSFADPETDYGWLDHVAVAGYFAIMIYVGFYFTKQSKTSKSFFRGSNNIPWWATGMSLFATGASALSLLSMPGKSYSTNWTFFGISIFSVISLPLSMYLLAPLVRKLNFATAFEYLEHRFGLSVRMFGSAIFVMQQILGRMGPVMLLPAIAMNAITGIDVKTCIIAMGVVTTLYTFLGGLAAVIWTDTIQGFVMIFAVLGCLILVYFKIDMPLGEMIGVLNEGEKLHTFNWSVNITQDNVMTMFFGIVAITLFGISDQNYVQRVQCTPTLKDAKKAIATQMAVAVPINLLLFGLGSALFLFYRANPGDLNPVMKTDGIFPFFAAQQLPAGVSGLVVAALLAATMSTISSAICSVSNLGVDDFYRRFNKSTSDRNAVIMGRILTLVVGGLGIAAALFLADFKSPSIWDLANRLITFITSATLGIFALGLFSRKANEIGVIAGIIAGMASTYYLKNYTAMSYWFYPLTGSIVTYSVGIAVSLVTGGNKKSINGLTLYTLNKARKSPDRESSPLDSAQ